MIPLPAIGLKLLGFVTSKTGTYLLIAGLVAGGVWYLRHDAARDAERALQARFERQAHQAQIAEMTRQKQAADAALDDERQRAAARETQISELQESLDAYQAEIDSGAARACPDDPSYRQRMRGIRIRP